MFPVVFYLENLFLSTLSLRRATLQRQLCEANSYISIHALLAESDLQRQLCEANSYISIHALLAESDPLGLPASQPSTPDFYPRSPCGERRSKKSDRLLPTNISIHALLAESDIISTILCLLPIKFLSTLSLRRATYTAAAGHHSRAISIHALLAESDPITKKPPLIVSAFLSTLSLRRATSLARYHAVGILFLSTLSLRRATVTFLFYNNQCRDFYPRSPCGERPTTIITICIVSRFLSTLSLRRATTSVLPTIPAPAISIHALLAESDIELAFLAINPITFLSTLSLRRATVDGPEGRFD